MVLQFQLVFGISWRSEHFNFAAIPEGTKLTNSTLRDAESLKPRIVQNGAASDCAKLQLRDKVEVSCLFKRLARGWINYQRHRLSHKDFDAAIRADRVYLVDV